MKGKRKLPANKWRRQYQQESLPEKPEVLAAMEEELTAGETDAAESEPSGFHTLPAIAIVGRPNVGKSSLFNVILRRRQAIVHFDAGVTRDRVICPASWDNFHFNLIDTGGLGMYSGEKRGVGFWDRLIEEQVEAAIESSERIIFVVDSQAGLSPLDEEIARRLRVCGHPVIVAVNKADSVEDEIRDAEFHQLGFDKVCSISCLHRRGIADLMSMALAGLEKTASYKSQPRLRIAVLGRPNVGKSSLVNRLLGEKRVIVSDIPGTTRDSIDSEFILKTGDEEIPAVLVDTAGLRKRSKIDEAVEQYSMMRAEEALNSCDIVLFVLEASKGEATSQDKTIARMIEESGKGCILVVNKWDIRRNNDNQAAILADIRNTLPKMLYAPVVFTSAETGFQFDKLCDVISIVRSQLSVKVTTSMLNKVIQTAVSKNLPPVVGLKPLKIYYGTMTDHQPPQFILFINKLAYCADSYRSYLTNAFREAFNFVGFPLRLILRERDRRDLSEVVNHAGSTHRKFANAKQLKEAKKKISKYRKERRKRD